MARRHTINPLESHLEKIILLVAFVVLGWVLFVSFMKPSGVEMNSEVLSASEAASAAASQAEEVASSIKQPSGNGQELVPDYEPGATQLFSMVTPYPADRDPLYPPIAEEAPEEFRIYRVPELLSLKKPEIQLTQGLAVIPEVRDSRTFNTLPSETVSGPKQEDVDLVTVSAVYAMADLYEAFDKSFGIEAEKPLDFTHPVVAVVDLQRRKLLADGSWGSYEPIQRLSIDPAAKIEISPKEIDTLSPVAYEVLLRDRRDYFKQLDLFRPKPYDLVLGDWKDPSVDEKDLAQGRGRSRTPKPSPQAGMNPMMMQMMMMGGRGGSSSSGRTPYGGSVSETVPSDLDTNEFTFWAIDSGVEPGAMYSYKLRLGFFNPIAGHNWFTKSQSELKDQRILWTNVVYPKQIVKIPPRTIFFPKEASSDPLDPSISVEIFRKQDGLWHNRRFKVAPGAPIGSVVTEKKETAATKSRRPNLPFGGAAAGADAAAESIEVDYRTGSTLLDIIPENTFWSIKPNVAKPVSCASIIYREESGSLKKIGVDKDVWPDQLIEAQKQITQMMRQQEKEESSPRGGRGQQMPGGMPGGFPGGMMGGAPVR